VKEIAPRLQEGLRRFSDHPLVGEVRGVGLVGAIELVSDKATKQPFDPKQAVGIQVQNRAQEQGLIIRAMGDSIAFCPPLIITAPEIDDLLARFGRALDEATAAIADGPLAKVA
jgi:4-aminobutyrate--pyruvate transaminase